MKSATRCSFQKGSCALIKHVMNLCNGHRMLHRTRERTSIIVGTRVIADRNLSSLCPEMAHKARTRSRQFPLSWALFATVPMSDLQSSVLPWFASMSFFDLPRLLFISGVQVNAVFTGRLLVIRKTFPPSPF